MCQMSMKLRGMFDQNPNHIFDKIVEKQIKPKKLSQSLILIPTVKVIAEIKKDNNLGNKKRATPKKLSRRSLSNWCDDLTLTPTPTPQEGVKILAFQLK